MQRIHWRKNSTTFACAALLLACSSDPVAGAKREEGVGTHARAVSPDDEGDELESEDASDESDGDDGSDEAGGDDDNTDGDDGSDEAGGDDDNTDGDDGSDEAGGDGDNTDGDDSDGDDGDNTDGDDGNDGDNTDGDNTDGDDGEQTPAPGGEGPLEKPERTVDEIGDTDATLDWKVLAAIKDKTQGASVLKAAYVNGALHVRIEGQGVSPNYHVFIDADGNPETGIQQGPWEATGIDLVVEGDYVYASDTSTGWVDTKQYEKITKKVDANSIELTIPGKLSGRSIVPSYGLGYLERPSSGGNWITALPLVNIARPPRAFPTTGIVIPAYLDQMEADTAGWTSLATQASAISGAGKDYWVAVNGPHNGPFGRQNNGEAVSQLVKDKLKSAAKKWKDIQDKGGKIFGYVHTCVTLPEEQRGTGAFTCVAYRPIEQVTADVEQWLKDYKDIDGIWIDEFYPHKDPTTVPLKANNQYDPTNSWHAKLTSMIASARPSGPKLLTVGNAGGRLFSDRREYAKLVDVLCTFESAKPGLEYVPATTSEVAKPGIALQPVAPRRGQLALVHNVQGAADMKKTLERVVKEGYSHLFITDGIFENHSLWKNTPRYFQKEIDAFLGKSITPDDSE